MKIINILLIICSIFFCSQGFAQEMDFSSPVAAFESYMSAATQRSFELSDSCYTQEFLDFTKNDQEYQSHRHPGQLTNSYNEYLGKRYTVEKFDNKAIMRFGPEYARPSPIYYIFERGQWKMDAMFMFNNIIMDDSTGGWFWRHENKDNERLWLNR